MAVVQCQMSIAIAALAVQIIARWCFALGCSTEKNLNGIHLLPSQTNHTSIGSTYGSDSYIGNSVGGGGAGHFSTHNLCILCTFLCKSVQDIVATRIIEILHINSIFKNRTMLFMFITNMTSGMWHDEGTEKSTKPIIILLSATWSHSLHLLLIHLQSSSVYIHQLHTLLAVRLYRWIPAPLCSSTCLSWSFSEVVLSFLTFCVLDSFEFPSIQRILCIL